MPNMGYTVGFMFPFISICVVYVNCLKVISFEKLLVAETESGEKTPESNIRTATLENEVIKSLPERFIICSSNKVSKQDHPVLYNVLDESGSNWLTLELDAGLIWGGLGEPSRWLVFAEMDFLPNTWYHTCVDIDSTNEQIVVGVNGAEMETLEGVAMATRPSSLVIGRSSAVPYSQYYWSMANLGIHLASPSSPSAVELSGQLCSRPGSILAWQPDAWTTTGNWTLVETKEVVEEQMCSNTTTTDLALPIQVSQGEGAAMCRRLGGGSMSSAPATEEAMDDFTTWFTESVQRPGEEGDVGKCWNIWTPYEEKEGAWVSLEDGSPATYLPWADGEGQEGDYQGYSIMIYTPYMPTPYKVVTPGNGGEVTPVCLACSLDSSFVVSLRGTCSGTTMGNLHLHSFF